MSSTRLTRLEQDVLDMLLAGDEPVLNVLRTQLLSSRIKSRTWTGGGFFTDFEVPESAPRVSQKMNFELEDVAAEIAGLAYGAGFILFVRAGLLSQLKGYSYVEPWNDADRDYRLFFVSSDFISLAKFTAMKSARMRSPVSSSKRGCRR
jgi:hypothetical protein